MGRKMCYLTNVGVKLSEQRYSGYRLDIGLKSSFVGLWADVLVLRMVEVGVEEG